MQELQHHGVAMGFPKDWLDVSLIVIAGPPNNKHAPILNMNWRPLEQGSSFEDFLQQQLIYIQQSFSEARMHTLHQGHRSLDSFPAYDFIYSALDPLINIQMTYWQVFVHVEAIIFVITATDRTEHFEETKPIFSEAISRFRVLPPENTT